LGVRMTGRKSPLTHSIGRTWRPDALKEG
jgi:hypothetical protein